MQLLYLPIDIDIPPIDVNTIEKLSIRMFWHYKIFWNTYTISKDQDFVKYILTQLPFKKITNIYYREQIGVVKPHLDVSPNMLFEEDEYENILSNEPSGYRIVLKGQPDTLSVHNGTSFKTAILPTIPGCYLLHATEGLHTVRPDAGRKILYFRGIVDPIRHKEIIDKNYQKYKDLAIVKD